MVFHSATLLGLVAVLVVAYWFFRTQTLRLWALLLASLCIYAWRHPPSLALLLGSILFNYAMGKVLERRPQKALLALGVVVNLSSLLYFKYASFIAAQLPFHVEVPPPWLPLGISFFTFQVIAYLVDVYRKEIPAEQNLLVFAVFKSFFAQLVAGPIVRGREFLPQLKTLRTIDFGQMYSGVLLVIAGLFLKIGVADPLAQHVDHAWADIGALSTNTAWFALYGYSAQLLADFCGYSTMAVGFGLMFGLALPGNFNNPYQSAGPHEFWRRWHITLSQWLRDYLYIPLGGNRRHANLNRMVTMTLGGLWHGAGWNYVLWGFLHGVWLGLTPRPSKKTDSREAPAPRWKKVVSMVLTFHGVALLWIPFRAPTMAAAQSFFLKLWQPPWVWKSSVATEWLILTFAFLAFQGAWFRHFPLQQRAPSRWDIPLVLAMMVWMLGYGSARLDFIYFVF